MIKKILNESLLRIEPEKIGPLDDIIRYYSELKEKFPTHTHLTVESCADGEVYMLWGCREETDAECTKRTQYENDRRKQEKEAEIRQDKYLLNLLIRKYGVPAELT